MNGKYRYALIVLAIGFTIFLVTALAADRIELNNYNASIEGEYTAVAEIGDKIYYLVDYSLDNGVLSLDKYYFSGVMGRITRGYKRIINGDYIITYKAGLIKEISSRK